uniref:VP8 n=1 Tax=Eyach virus TaxID=62352 RepID=A0A8G0VK71_9REOV|nr:VP8 [Eyach virus]
MRAERQSTVKLRPSLQAVIRTNNINAFNLHIEGIDCPTPADLSRYCIPNGWFFKVKNQNVIPVPRNFPAFNYDVDIGQYTVLPFETFEDVAQLYESADGDLIPHFAIFENGMPVVAAISDRQNNVLTLRFRAGGEHFLTIDDLLAAEPRDLDIYQGVDQMADEAGIRLDDVDQAALAAQAVADAGGGVEQQQDAMAGVVAQAVRDLPIAHEDGIRLRDVAVVQVQVAPAAPIQVPPAPNVIAQRQREQALARQVPNLHVLPRPRQELIERLEQIREAERSFINEIVQEVGAINQQRDAAAAGMRLDLCRAVHRVDGILRAYQERVNPFRLGLNYRPPILAQEEIRVEENVRRLGGEVGLEDFEILARPERALLHEEYLGDLIIRETEKLIETGQSFIAHIQRVGYCNHEGWCCLQDVGVQVQGVDPESYLPALIVRTNCRGFVLRAPIPIIRVLNQIIHNPSGLDRLEASLNVLMTDVRERVSTLQTADNNRRVRVNDPHDLTSMNGMITHVYAMLSRWRDNIARLRASAQHQLIAQELARRYAEWRPGQHYDIPGRVLNLLVNRQLRYQTQLEWIYPHMWVADRELEGVWILGGVTPTYRNLHEWQENIAYIGLVQFIEFWEEFVTWFPHYGVGPINHGVPVFPTVFSPRMLSVAVRLL